MSQRKRSARAATPASDVVGEPADEGIEMADLSVLNSLVIEREALYSSIKAAGVYNMRLAGEKERLARDLWAGDFSASMHELRNANPELVAVLHTQISNKSDVTSCIYGFRENTHQARFFALHI